MRGLTRRWVFQRQHEDEAGAAGADAGLFDRLLRARGLVDAQTIQRFCEPDLKNLHDPGLLPGIDVAAERLVAAVQQGEQIVIYGDYDVDGITATAILYHVIKTVRPDARVRSYVPHRLDEGYGINCEALRQLRQEGADVVLSVDCGITAIESARTASDLGVDLIITDHHHPPAPEKGLPEAVALVHPALPGSRYPFADLCGAGVAFKLAWRFATTFCGSERVSEALRRVLLDMLPLVALGTIADVVPLVDENRILVSYGLRRIKQTPLAGLRALIEVSKLMEDRIDCEEVGFRLAPRLNACGRMGHAAEAVHLLTRASPAEAIEIAQRLDEQNRLRQRTERDIFEQAAQRAEDAGMTGEDRRIIILADESWHPGVVGIVCSRLAEEFGRPAILLKDEGDSYRGSARGVEGYSIHEGIASGQEYLTRFGGHAAAAGLSLPAANFEAFREAVTAHANAHLTPEQLVPAVKIDCDASLGELDFQTVRRITSLSPFGRANPQPKVRVQGAVLAAAPSQMGAHGRHLSLRLREDGPSGRKELRMVWWGAGRLAGDLAPGMRLDAVVEPKLNTWRGETSVQPVVQDVRVLEA